MVRNFVKLVCGLVDESIVGC